MCDRQGVCKDWESLLGGSSLYGMIFSVNPLEPAMLGIQTFVCMMSSQTLSCT